MKTALFLVAALVVLTGFTGCSKKEETPDGSTPADSSPTDSSPTSEPTGSPPVDPPPIPDPKEIYAMVLSWGANANDPGGTMTVDANVTMLEIKIWVNSTAAGPWSLQGDGAPPTPGFASAMFTDPADQSVEIEFRDVFTAGAGASSQVLDELAVVEVPVPAGGAWAVSITGRGQNVQADIHVTERFD